MRVPRGRGDNRDRDRGYKEKHQHQHQHGQAGRSDRNKAIDRDDNWRARTVEEADAYIDKMQGAVGPEVRPEGRPGGRPQAAPAPSPGSRGADASSPQDPEAAAELQESPPQDVWPALGSATALTAEAENPMASSGHAGGSSNTAPSLMNCCTQALPANPVMVPAGTAMPAGVLTMGPGSGQMGQMVVMAMAGPYGASADGQIMAPDDAALPNSARPAVKAAPGPPPPAVANASLLAAGGPPGASAQKQMLPVKASTKAFARSNAKAMPKVQAPFASQAAGLAAAPSPATMPAPKAVLPAPAPAATGSPEEVSNRVTAPPAVALLVPTMMPLEGGAPGAPGPSSSAVTLGMGPNALAKAAPAPAPVPVQTGLAPALGAGAGEGGNTSGSANNEAVVEAGEGDGSELKTLLGRGAAPPSGDADAKLGRGSVRLQGVEDWVLYLQPRREGEAQQTPAPVRRAVAGARGRGRGRIMNLKLDRVRGAGRAAAPATSGEDGNEASVTEAAEEAPQPALETPAAPTPTETPCGSARDGAAEANAVPSAGTSASSQAAPVQPASTTQNGSAAVNAWAPQATASATLGRGGSITTQHPRRRGRAWEDIDGMLDLDGEEESSQNTATIGTAAVSSTSDGSSLPASGNVSTAAAERRTCSPATGSPAAPCVEGSPAAASTAAVPSSEPQASEDSSAFAVAGGTSAVSSTSGAGSNTAASGTAASAERRPSASEASVEAAASTVAAASGTEAQAIEASSSSTSPASPGALASSTASSTRPRPEAPSTASAAPGAAPASGTSAGGGSAAGLLRLAQDLPAGASEAGGAGGWAGGGGGGWERNFRRDDELLRACGLWCKKVEADGACLFRAFSDQLEGDGGSKHLQYREKCVTYMEEYRADFEPFITSNFKGYCAKLREPAAWGGHVEAQALSRALGVNCLIHLPNEAEAAEEVPDKAIEVLNFEDAPCVQLCFHPRYHSGPHYNSVRSCGDKGDGVPSAAKVSELRERMLEVLRTRRQRQGGTTS